MSYCTTVHVGGKTSWPDTATVVVCCTISDAAAEREISLEAEIGARCASSIYGDAFIKVVTKWDITALGEIKLLDERTGVEINLEETNLIVHAMNLIKMKNRERGTVSGVCKFNTLKGRWYSNKMTERINVLNSFVEAVMESKATNKPTYINHHGGHVFKTYNINQERVVTNIVLGTDGSYEQDIHLMNSAGSFVTQNVYYPGQLQPHAFQLSPSAWVAMDSCIPMEPNYMQKKVGNVLTAMDSDSNFEQVSHDEFLAACPMGEAIFHDLDMEGSTFEDDVMFCELNGCEDTGGQMDTPNRSELCRILQSL